MLKVKDIMTQHVFCVSKDTPMCEVIEAMVNGSISSVPVVEDDMTLAGVLSQGDVARRFHAHECTKNETAGDFMTQPAIHFEEDDNLLDLCSVLRDNPCSRASVTSNGKVVGVVNRSDILEHILAAIGRRNTSEDAELKQDIAVDSPVG